MGVRTFVCKMEQVLIDICKHYDVKAGRTRDTGVWINNQRKIGAIGQEKCHVLGEINVYT